MWGFRDDTSPNGGRGKEATGSMGDDTPTQQFYLVTLDLYLTTLDKILVK